MSQDTPGTPWEAKIDELTRQQAAALDPAERRRLFAEMQRVFGENVPALYFVAPDSTRRRARASSTSRRPSCGRSCCGPPTPLP